MKWQKKGLIYRPDDQVDWRAKYGMMPTPIHLAEQGIIRVYFGVTTTQNYGRTTFIDLNDQNPSEVVRNSNDEPTLDLGEIGTFDDAGAIPSSVILLGTASYMYYVGFQRCIGVPYMLFPGLAISGLDHKFKRHTKSPIIDRTNDHCLSFAAPFVMREDEKFKMWLWIGKSWITLNGKMYIQATIGYAESKDGLAWKIVSSDCIVPDQPAEFSVGRPWVIKDQDTYKMFYSVRYVDKLYRLGYAESIDGIKWIRKDAEIGIDVSMEGWDSEMICYPAVIKVNKRTYLFYNGNNNGETGFGLAELLNE